MTSVKDLHDEMTSSKRKVTITSDQLAELPVYRIEEGGRYEIDMVFRDSCALTPTFSGPVTVVHNESESEAAYERDVLRRSLYGWQQDHALMVHRNAQLHDELAHLRSENAMLERDNADLASMKESLIDAGNTAFELARGQEDMADIISDQREELDYLYTWIEGRLQCYPQRVVIGFDGSDSVLQQDAREEFEAVGLMEDPLLGSVYVAPVDAAAWDAAATWEESIKAWSASCTIPAGTMSRSAFRLIFGIELPYVEPEDHIVLGEN